MPPAQQQIPPAPSQQPDPNLDFTQNNQLQGQQQPPAQAPPTPPADQNITQLQNDIAEIKAALTQSPQQEQQPSQQPQTSEEKKAYGDWGEVFSDVEQLVDSKFQEAQQQNQKTNEQIQQQEQENQQYIDQTVNQLRQAGYLPPVTNQFDANDPGKIAENELLGYAVYGIGTTDLVKAAQELKFRHDAGYKFDYQNKTWQQVNQPSNNPNDQMFGSLPQFPDQQGPVQPQVQPQQFQQPVGPQNPYVSRQYPPGFNAPVSSGNTFQGTQGQVPSQSLLRRMNYDQLVENFNRSQ